MSNLPPAWSTVSTTSNADRRVFYDRWKAPGDKARYKNIANRETTPPTDRFVATEYALEGSSLKLSYTLPDACPVCGAPVVRDEDGAALRCTGAECPAQLQRNITHFASRDAMDIEGLGPAVVAQLVDYYYQGDLLEAGVAKAGEKYDYNPDNWELSKYVDMSNVYCAIYQEELCGYMAGYAAVKLGYKNLGFLGGMAVPAVVRYGYGFVQGVDAAAAEMKLTDVKVNYIYGGQFFGDADITAVMDTWYNGGTEVVFACGGGIYTSAVDAAKKVNGAKVIGVDVDQAGVIAKYAAGEGADQATIDGFKALTVTSAMKGLYPATFDTLTDVIVKGNWDNYKGKIQNLGLVSGDDPTLNYVQIPMGEGTQWSDSFTQDDYKAMVKEMFDGTLTVSNDITKAAKDFATVITVDDQGKIKG